MKTDMPTISQYVASVTEPFGVFRTLGEIECMRDLYGEPVFVAGGNAVVFKVRIDGKFFALKCYTKTHQRSRHICNAVANDCTALIEPMRYLPDEIYVYEGGAGDWYDVVLSDWIEGATLDIELERALHHGDTKRIAQLAKMFDNLAVRLLQAEWAHGDLKPENIFITNSGEMRLIDADAMYHPIFEGLTAFEIGTPQYQHPQRNERHYDRHIDDYSIVLISATLHSLSLWHEMNKQFGNKDYYLLNPGDIIAGCSGAYTELREQAAKGGHGRLYTLLGKLTNPTPQIEDLGELLAKPTHTTKPLTTYCSGGRWGYKNNDDTIAIPPIYDTALEFSNGLALVSVGNYLHFVDADGTCAINCSDCESAKPFRNGKASVKRNGKWEEIKR